MKQDLQRAPQPGGRFLSAAGAVPVPSGDEGKARLMRETIVRLAVAGSAISAFTILLGRLWTTSYFEYFGLPVADLNLGVHDYAFRTKEILLMLLLASALVAGIAWGAEAIGLTTRWTRYTRLWAAVFALVVVLLAAFIILAALGAPLVENWWRWLAVGLGVALGIGAGLAVAFARMHGSPWARITAGVVVVALVLVVPFSIVRLARASAAYNVGNQNLAHAVLLFEQQAPAPIRRLDDETRSNRVYLVLSTPERLAVAFPYPCSQVGTATSGAQLASADRPEATELCDILTFDRQLVTSIEILGKGERPANDEPAKAEIVSLATDPDGADGFSSRVVYDQAYDFSQARVDESGCGPASGVQGVWLRLEAHQAGRVEPIGFGVPAEGSPSGSELTSVLVNADDETVCGELNPPQAGQSEPWSVRLDAGTAVRLFVGIQNVDEDDPRRTVMLRYWPLSAEATDCTVGPATQDGPAVGCRPDADAGGGLGTRMRLPADATLIMRVDVASSEIAPIGDDGCPRETLLPTLSVAGTSLDATGCQPSQEDPGVTTVTFEGFTRTMGDGLVEVAACPPAEATARILGLRGTLAAAEESPTGQDGPTPEPESASEPFSESADVVVACAG